MRTILYTGKGGVGKTSVAAATAVKSAGLGKRTVVISTDIAHSLGDSLDVKLSGSPAQLAEKLWAMEIDVYQELETHWSTVRNWLTTLMRWQGADDLVAEEMAILPGMEELVGLLHLTNFIDGADYDVMIVDCAPTGETLRLLSFPETASWYMKRIFPLERRAISALRPLIKPVLRLPVPEESVFDSVEFLFKQVDKMRALLTDSEFSSVRLVVNPEKMVVREAQRTFTYLNLYGYSTDLIVCNRIIPQEVADKYFNGWKESQAKYFRLIQEGFSPVPIRTAPLFDSEVVGIPKLRDMGDALFGDEDPTAVFFRGQAQKVDRENGRYSLTIPLPFVSKEEVSLLRSGDELVIQAGQHRRNVILPRSLVGLEVQEAKLTGDELKLRFEERKSPRLTKKREG